VLQIAGDPVQLGLVASLGRPGRNITGVTSLNVEVMPKQLELLHGAGDREFGPYASGRADIAATAGLQVACLRLACDRRDIDEREPARVPEYLPQLITQTGKPLLFIGPSTPDSAFQACIDQFEIKDGNRLRNSG
jgi:hypothetical protein